MIIITVVLVLLSNLHCQRSRKKERQLEVPLILIEMLSILKFVNYVMTIFN